MPRPTAPELTAPLVSPELYAGDPFPLYERLRREAPVVWNEDPGFWVLSRHREVLEVSRDPHTYCSSKGVLLMDLGRELPEVPGALLYVDPPDHQRYRALVQPAFSPSRMKALESAVRDRARDLLGTVEADRPFDVVSQLAVPFPLVVIAELLGVPVDDWPRLYEWSEAAIDAGTAQTDENLTKLVEMADYFLAAAEDKRRRPGSDLISTLVAAVDDQGRSLDDSELLMLCGQLLVAGNETTRNLISAGLVALAEHPAQWALLVQDPSRVPAAVEELLRWTTPVISFMRTATTEAVLAGRRIEEGDPLLLLYSSANRDPDEFGPDAGELDVVRRPNHHLAFGFGEHFCLGAALARMEARIVLEEVLGRFSRIVLAGEVSRLPSAGVVAGITEASLVLA